MHKTMLVSRKQILELLTLQDVLETVEEVYAEHEATLAALGVTTHLGEEIGRVAAFDAALLEDDEPLQLVLRG